MKHSGENLRSQERWCGEEYLQGDEWKMQGEEEQVVLMFIVVSILNLVPFPRLEYKLSGLHREKCH